MGYAKIALDYEHIYFHICAFQPRIVMYRLSSYTVPATHKLTFQHIQ
jgi:hypothetical protein